MHPVNFCNLDFEVCLDELHMSCFLNVNHSTELDSKLTDSGNIHSMSGQNDMSGCSNLCKGWDSNVLHPEC